MPVINQLILSELTDVQTLEEDKQLFLFIFMIVLERGHKVTSLNLLTIFGRSRM